MITGSGTRLAAIPVLALSSAITSLDFTIIFVAIPDVQEGFSATVADTQWVAAVYAVAYGAFLLLGGRLSGVLGAHVGFVAGLAGFAGFSALGGLAPNLITLVAARAGQGLCAALLFPSTLALVHALHRGTARHRALAIWAAAGSGGLIAGALLGGVLTQLFGWRGVMWVNVPLVGIALHYAVRSIPRSLGHRAVARLTVRTWLRSGVVAATMGAVCLALARLDVWRAEWPTWICVVIAVAGLCALRRGPGRQEPLVPERVSQLSSVRRATVFGAVFMGAFGSLFLIVSLDLQAVRNLAPAWAGLAMVPGSLGGMVGSALSAPLLRRHSASAVARGSMVVGGLGLLAVAGGLLGSLPVLLVVVALASVAQGVAYASIFALAAEGVEARDQGSASSTVSTGQQIGSAVGLAAVAWCVQAIPGGGVITAGLIAATVGGGILVTVVGLLARIRPTVST